MKRAKVVVAAILVVLVVIVLMQNTGPVRVQLLFTPVSMPCALLLLVVVLIGFALGLLTAHQITRRSRKPKK